MEPEPEIETTDIVSTLTSTLASGAAAAAAAAGEERRNCAAAFSGAPHPAAQVPVIACVSEIKGPAKLKLEPHFQKFAPNSGSAKFASIELYCLGSFNLRNGANHAELETDTNCSDLITTATQHAKCHTKSDFPSFSTRWT